jgi:hypothetical protein
MKLLSVILLLASIASPLSLQAAEQDEPRNHALALYLWGAGLDGHVGNKAGGLPVDVSFSDILDNLEGAFMVNYRGEFDNWALNADYIYLNIAPSTDKPSATLDVKQAIWEVSAGYEIRPGLELLAGLRYVDMRTALRLDFLPGSPTVNVAEDWLDPIVGLDYRTALSDKWVFYGRADIGGFGVGSELTWQLGAYFGYKPSPNWNLFGGYRHLVFDYESDDPSQFFYDMAISGPLLGVSFKFL